MATIREIAKAAGFSPSTVSIVLSGKADERKISENTKAKILDVAHQLGYRVNVAARRLRISRHANMKISVFMTMDKRAYLMMRFLLGLQSAAEKYDQHFEIVVHYYKNDSLHLFKEEIKFTNCVVICNASEDDIHFLEAAQFSIPIVLFYRSSKKYCTVNADHSLIGKMAADIFVRRGHKNSALVSTGMYYSEQSEIEFTKAAKLNGLSVKRINETHDIGGGYSGGVAIGKMDPLPTCVFSTYNPMSIGILRAFGQRGIKVPEQVELISIGFDNPDLEEYASVSISTISIPTETMAEECLRLLLVQLNGKMDEPSSVEVPVVYIPRESCGE